MKAKPINNLPAHRANFARYWSKLKSMGLVPSNRREEAAEQLREWKCWLRRHGLPR